MSMCSCFVLHTADFMYFYFMERCKWLQFLFGNLFTESTVNVYTVASQSTV